MVVVPWKHPFTSMISGPTGCGKTVFTKKFIQYVDSMVNTPITEIIWCFGVSQPMHQEISALSKVPIKFFEGVPDLEEMCGVDSKPRLVIVDDLFRQADGRLVDLFTRSSHHRSLSVIFITQNLYFQKPGMREISLNTQYNVVFFNARDRTQIKYFCRQVDPDNVKALMEAYKDATSQPHGYLVFDLTQTAEERLRYRTNIFPDEDTVLYVPKKNI
jgi:Cdc6-like AAA superfamily ATPase